MGSSGRSRWHAWTPPRAGVGFCGLRPTEKDPLGVSGSEEQFWKKTNPCPQNNLQCLNLLTKEFVGFLELEISTSQFGSFPPNRSFNRLRFSPLITLWGCWAVLSKKRIKYVYTDAFMSYTYMYAYYIHIFGLVAQPLLKPSKKTFPTQTPKNRSINFSQLQRCLVHGAGLIKGCQGC